MRSRKRRLSREPLGAFDNGFRIHLSPGNCHRARSLSLNGSLLEYECLSVRAPRVHE